MANQAAATAASLAEAAAESKKAAKTVANQAAATAASLAEAAAESKKALARARVRKARSAPNDNGRRTSPVFCPC